MRINSILLVIAILLFVGSLWFVFYYDDINNSILLSTPVVDTVLCIDTVVVEVEPVYNVTRYVYLHVDTVYENTFITDTVHIVDTVSLFKDEDRTAWAYVIAQQAIQEYFKDLQIQCGLYSKNQIDTVYSFGAPTGFESLFSSGFTTKAFYVFKGTVLTLSEDNCVITKYFYEVALTYLGGDVKEMLSWGIDRVNIE